MPKAPGQVIPFSPPTRGALAERTDDELVLLCAAGQTPAFEVLVDRYLPRLQRYCGKLVGSPALGEELAQEVLLEVWTQSGRYRPLGQFIAFLFRIARSRGLNQLRGARRSQAVESSPEGSVRPDSFVSEIAIDVLLENERLRRSNVALAALPPKLREAVLLRFDQNLDYREIARIVGTFESTARSRVFHGLRKLQRALAEGDR